MPDTFAGVVTVNVLRELWTLVIESHKDDIAFYSRWSDTLDTTAQEHNPKALWVPPTVNVVPEVNTFRTTFQVNLIFLDQTASDRSAEDRDDTYERMQVLCVQCLARFNELYFQQESIYEGVNISLKQEGNATLTAVWDTVAEMTTGCRMSVTISSPYQICASDYFNA